MTPLVGTWILLDEHAQVGSADSAWPRNNTARLVSRNTAECVIIRVIFGSSSTNPIRDAAVVAAADCITPGERRSRRSFALETQGGAMKVQLSGNVIEEPNSALPVAT